MSFRIEDDDAAEAQAWAERLGLERSELLREAVRRHLDLLRAHLEATTWVDEPDEDGALAAGADWEPAEDRVDGDDAEG